MTKERFNAIMDQVMEEIPLSLENEADGRDTWPRRWKELRKYVEADINLENISDTEETDELERCPDCGKLSVRAKGLGEGGGVECITPGCGYWFCY